MEIVIEWGLRKESLFFYNQLWFIPKRSAMKTIYLEVWWSDILLVTEKYQQTRSPHKHLLLEGCVQMDESWIQELVGYPPNSCRTTDLKLKKKRKIMWWWMKTCTGGWSSPWVHKDDGGFKIMKEVQEGYQFSLGSKRYLMTNLISVSNCSK